MSDEKDIFHKVVSTTEADERDEYIVKDILRDKDYGWKLNYYSPNDKPSWTISVIRSRKKIEHLKANIIKHQTILAKIDEDTDCSRLDPTDDKYKKLTRKEKEEMNRLYAIAIDSINEDNNNLEELINIHRINEINECVEITRTQFLRKIRNEFRTNRELDYLKRAVTWAINYTEKLRGCPRLPVSEEQKSFSAW